MNKMLLIGAAVMAAVVTVSAADVKENWDKNCAKCHGADGKGDTKMGKKLEIKDFTDAKYQASMKDEEMLKAMKDGVKESPLVTRTGVPMPLQPAGRVNR